MVSPLTLVCPPYLVEGRCVRPVTHCNLQMIAARTASQTATVMSFCFTRALSNTPDLTNATRVHVQNGIVFLSLGLLPHIVHSIPS